MDYRTQEQWDEICDEVANGNWVSAAGLCFDGGFYAADMVRFYQDDYCPRMIEATDLALLAELTQKLRR